MAVALIVIAVVLVLLRVVGLLAMLPSAGLPPGTPWRIRRAHKRNRADLRAMRTDRRRWVAPARHDF